MSMVSFIYVLDSLFTVWSSRFSSSLGATEKVSQMVTEMVVELIKFYFVSEQQNTVPKGVDETHLNVTGPLYGPS